VKLNELRDLVREVIKEAAAEGQIQKIYRRSYKKMIKKTKSGKNPNTAPFTEEAPEGGASGPPAQ
tara:strand:- start:1556 stop:1750 length:195 start_codon:yes stop_codon:yes gene_type:complete